MRDWMITVGAFLSGVGIERLTPGPPEHAVFWFVPGVLLLIVGGVQIRRIAQ